MTSATARSSGARPDAPGRLPRLDLLDRVFVCCFALLSIVSLLPIWITRFLPLVDEPNHLSAIYIWHGLQDPSSPLHRFYALNIAPVSYFLHYFVAHQAAWLVGVEAGHKFALSLYVLGCPLAALLWCIRTERTPWLSVLIFPLSYSFLWAFGFHPFNFGLLMLYVGVIAFDLLFERPTPVRALCAAGASVLCFLSHPIPLMMLYLAVPVLLFTHGVRWRAAIGGALAVVPSLLLLYWQARQSSTLATDWSAIAGGKLLVSSPPQWLRRLSQLPDIMNVVAGTRDTQAFKALMLCGGLLLGAGLTLGKRGCARFRGWLHCYRGLVLAAAMLAGYLALPEHSAPPVGILIISGRFAPAACFFFLTAAAIPPTDWRRLIALAAVPIALFAAWNVTTKYREFARYMAPLPELVARCPPSANILTLSMPPQALPAVTDLVPFRLLPAWVQVLHGGYAPDHWERPIPFPFRVKQAPPAPSWMDPTPTPALLSGPYGCIVAHGIPPGLPNANWQLDERVGMWSLYRRR